MPTKSSQPSQVPKSRQNIFDLMGHSLSIRQIHQQIQRVAGTNFTVIVQGETGTGKELVARLIHEQSHRTQQPFVAIDCGAIPESIVESELFGYVRGAFTGAVGKKAGYFELAKGGTLFLDEITNLSSATQMKLLRSLQERRILPLGSTNSVRTDVRIIAASNAVLENEVQAGRFRDDLFHRLNEFKIYLLPLRQRPEDIFPLAERFRRETNAELHKNVSEFSAEARAYLLAYNWPGNVRELRNTVRRAVLLSTSTIEVKHLRQMLAPPTSVPPVSAIPLGDGLHAIVQQMSVQLEKGIIERVLKETGDNKSQAAKRLKISYKTLYRKLKKYNIT
jgi:two-component system nitrogen regulation response regulator GlnG